MKFEVTPSFVFEVHDAIKHKRHDDVVKMLEPLHPADIAELIKESWTHDAQYVYNLLDEEKAGDVLVEMDDDVRDGFLASLSSEQIAKHIDNLDSDDAADLIADLPDEKIKEVLEQMDDAEQASDIVDLLRYDEDTAGGLMATELVTANLKWTVQQSIVEMKRQAEEVGSIYTVYVIDDDEKLHGILSLKRLLISPPEEKIEKIYFKDVISINAAAKSEDVATLFEKYDLVVIPVVDITGKLLGRITVDDVMDVVREEASEDYQLMSGISENIEADDNLWVSTRARLPWLMVALAGGVVGSRVLTSYEPQIQIHPEMAFFMPLIAAMGGNVGVQSSALVVQGLANNTIGKGDIIPKLFRELMVGLFNGLICAVLLLAYNLIFNDYMALSVTVSVALLSVIVFAAIFGAFVPLVLNKFKIDPALATGPFITTSNDIIGLFIYFMIGRLMYGLF